MERYKCECGSNGKFNTEYGWFCKICLIAEERITPIDLIRNSKTSLMILNKDKLCITFESKLIRDLFIGKIARYKPSMSFVNVKTEIEERFNIFEVRRDVEEIQKVYITFYNNSDLMNFTKECEYYDKNKKD